MTEILRHEYDGAAKQEGEKIAGLVALVAAAMFSTSDGEPRAFFERKGKRYVYVTYILGHRGMEDRRKDVAQSMVTEVLEKLKELGAVELVWRVRPAFSYDETHVEREVDPVRITHLRLRCAAIDSAGNALVAPAWAKPEGAPVRGDYMRDAALTAIVSPRDGVSTLTTYDPEAAAAYAEPDVTEHDVVTYRDEAVLLCDFACHEAIRALNDAYNEPTLGWEPNRASVVAGVRRILANPGETYEQNHEAWMQYKLSEGWVFGSEKSADKKTHPCLVPYSALPPVQRAKDMIFTHIVRAFFGLVSP